jgi:hypothetical protein
LGNTYLMYVVHEQLEGNRCKVVWKVSMCVPNNYGPLLQPKSSVKNNNLTE